MIGPFLRSGRRARRYQRQKLIAAVVTIVALSIYLKFFASGKEITENVERWSNPVVSPAVAFEERSDGVQVKAEAVVEKVLADTTLATGLHQRLKLRTLGGHPVVWVRDLSGVERLAVVVGDTVSCAGTYRWDSRGGTVESSPSDR